jgi:hypothetical protein
MALTASISELARYTTDRFQNNLAALGLEAAYYGDQDKLPVTPVVCIEPSDKSRALNGAPRRTLVEIDLYVLLYLTKVQSPQLNREQCDQLAEAVEAFLHADNNMGGRAIHSLVTRIESGFVNKANTLVRASRLTYTITSQQMLPYP